MSRSTFVIFPLLDMWPGGVCRLDAVVFFHREQNKKCIRHKYKHDDPKKKNTNSNVRATQKHYYHYYLKDYRYSYVM